MRLGFIGFGLIGGSVARALRANLSSATWRIAAWTPSGTGPSQAAADGVIDLAARSPLDAIEGADLVVLAGPPTACLEALDSLGGAWRSAVSPSATVTDVASTKRLVVERADAVGLRFVGGHPMAGLEVSGYGAARPDLFTDRPWVIVPGQHAAQEDVQRVEDLVTACGARPLRLDAASHDRAVAGISHLPLVLAAALVETVVGDSEMGPRDDWPTAARLAANGWRDMTRLARGDPGMGAAIAATNATELAARLAAAEQALASWREALTREGGPDEAAIRDRFETAKRRLMGDQ